MSNGSDRLLKTMIRQVEVLIRLVGRKALSNDDVKKIVTFKKKYRAVYVKVYNSCDGNHSVTELARIAGVKRPTMSEILKSWEEEGILYVIENLEKQGTFYKKLFPIR